MLGFEHFGMGFWMILLWLVPILLIALVLGYFTRDRDEKARRTTLDILGERYARGEIDRDEYLKRRADLTE